MAKIIINLSKKEYERCKKACSGAFNGNPTKKQIDKQIIENIMCDWYAVDEISLEVKGDM